MIKVIPKVIKNSVPFRTEVILSNCNTLKNYVNYSEDTTIVQNLKQNDKTNIKTLNPLTKNGTFRDLINEFKNSNKLDNVIQIMKVLHTELNVNNRLCMKNFKEIKEFENMCSVVLKNARSLSTYDTLCILQVLISLNIPPNTVIIQTLLKLVQSYLHKLTVGQIMMVYTTLYKFKEFPSIKPLLIALSYVFTQQAQLELNSESTHLLKVLQFCFIIKDITIIEHIIYLLLKNQQHIYPKDIKCIFYAIYLLPTLCSFSKYMLKKIQNIIIKDAEYLNLNHIDCILYYISKKVKVSNMDFYNEDTIEALTSAAICAKCTLHQAINILKNLNYIRVSNISLLNYLAEECLKNTDSLEQCTNFEVDCIINGFVIANYKPPCWETLKTMLQDFVISRDYSLSNAALAAFHLLSLDFYCPELVEKVFSLYNKFSYISKDKQITLLMLKLHWCVKLLYPSYKGIMLDESILNQITVEYESNNIPDLKKCLEEVVGGVNFMKNGLKTNLSQSVDYVVVLQSNGTFMNISYYDNITFIEELTSLSECNKILFFAFPKEAYCMNKKNILSTVKMQLRAIETLPGFHSFDINPYLWETFHYQNKKLYLQQAIELKYNNVLNNKL